MPSWLPEERAIYEVMQQIEGLGAHHKLTEAVIKLQEAKEALADWWDEQLTFSPTSKETPQWIIDNLKPESVPPIPFFKRPIVTTNNTTVDFHGKCSGVHIFPRDSKYYQQSPNGEWEEVEP